MEIQIKNFVPSDTEACITIKEKNFKEINKKTPEQIAGIRERFISSCKERKYFVAKYKNNIVGIGGHKDNELYTFFVDPKYHGKGIGRLLMEKNLAEIQQLGYKEAFVSASQYAKAFYEHFGFIVEKPEEHGGYFMKKIF